MKTRMNALTALAGLTVSWLLLQSPVAHAICPDVNDSYNPFLVEGVIAPAPLLPVEFSGTGQLSFDVGNTGGTELCLVTGEETGLKITMSKGVPDNVDPIAAIGGTGKGWFSWTYEPSTTTYTAKQIQVIPANSRETVTIDYRVTVNSFLASSPTTSNGFNNNLQPPAYTNISNAPGDDNVSSFTYVEAKDYGDAPVTYGSAWHIVDVETRTDGRYLKYSRIGSVVDPEDQMQSDVQAVGDDANQSGGLGSDDEDGVVFPPMSPGDTAVPIEVTLFFPDSFMTDSFLHVWIDWNRDGTFEGTEKVYTSPSSTRASGVVTVPVDVPAVATVGVYYARFRLGPEVNAAGDDFLGPTGEAEWGEVEDHIFPVGDPTVVTIGKVDLQAVSVEDFLDGIGIEQMDDAALLALLEAWDPVLAASLAGAGRDAFLAALQQYLDPDGDGQVAALRWDTLEERGTIGFYVDRRVGEEGAWTRINNDMLPGLITAPMGGEYQLVDPAATSGNTYHYQLIEQEARGNTRTYGPFTVEMP